MTSVAYALLIAFAVSFATLFIHYEILGSTWLATPVARVISVRAKMVLVLSGIFVAHVLEISLYAFCYYLMHDHLGLGEIVGNTSETYFDFFYFSATSYTTLGFGDLYPQGPIRIVVAIESLNGLVLIGWSTSYTYLAMQRFSRMNRRTPLPTGKTETPR